MKPRRSQAGRLVPCWRPTVAPRVPPVPSTIRLLVRALVLAGLVWGSLWLLATFVDPAPREIVVNVPVGPATP